MRRAYNVKALRRMRSGELLAGSEGFSIASRNPKGAQATRLTDEQKQ